MKTLILIMSLLPAMVLANPYMNESFGDGPPPRHCMMDKGMPLPPYLEHLDLSKTQQQQIRDLIKANIDKVKSNYKQEFVLLDQIHQLSFSTDFDASKVGKLVSKLVKIHRKTMLDRAQLDHEIYARLTKTQQQKLQKRMQALEVLHSDS